MERDLDRLLAAWDPAMIVVVADDGVERSGCLVGFHGQCSIEPRRYAVWVSRRNHTFTVAGRSAALSVHFLGDGDHDVAAVFGTTTGDELDKWEALDGLGLRLPEVGFTGPVVAVHDDAGSDHVCFVIEADALLADGPPDTTAAPLRLGDVGDLHPGHPA